MLQSCQVIRFKLSKYIFWTSVKYGHQLSAKIFPAMILLLSIFHSFPLKILLKKKKKKISTLFQSISILYQRQVTKVAMSKYIKMYKTTVAVFKH